MSCNAKLTDTIAYWLIKGDEHWSTITKSNIKEAKRLVEEQELEGPHWLPAQLAAVLQKRLDTAFGFAAEYIYDKGLPLDEVMVALIKGALETVNWLAVAKLALVAFDLPPSAEGE